MFFMWAAFFFLIAIVAAAFGFTDIAADASEIARILFYVSLMVFLLLLISGLFIFKKVKSFASGLGTKDNSKGFSEK
jgi:uncharacterized membrane protein YtjA (UPF0391 family)